jgi:pyruvate/oxaloacetate carboxyltransferase
MVGSAAVFETCIKFLNENPWERFKLFRQLMPQSSLGFLIRGKVLFGWNFYPDDVVSLTFQCLKKNGINWVTIFDALNDTNNLKWPIKVAKELGMEVNGALMFTISPVHTDEYYAKKAKKFIENGSDIVSIQDASGLLTPERTRSLKFKPYVMKWQVEIKFHGHCNTGLANESYYSAIDAGVDIIDTLTAPLSQGNSLPSTLEMMDYVYQVGQSCKIQEKYVRN